MNERLKQELGVDEDSLRLVYQGRLGDCLAVLVKQGKGDSNLAQRIRNIVSDMNRIAASTDPIAKQNKLLSLAAEAEQEYLASQES